MRKIAILSATGSGKKRTIPALEGSDFARVVAIHGRESEKLRDLGSSFGIPTYSNIEDIIATDADLLYIASPPFLHAEQAIPFLQRGYPIICEKPLCVSPDEIAIFKDNVRAPFMVAHHLRHQQAASTIKQIVGSKQLGNVCSAHMQWNFQLNRSAPSAEWKLNPDLGGNHPFFDAGIHVIDMAQYVFGQPKSVYATGVLDRELPIYKSASATFDFVSFPVFMAASTVQTLANNDFAIFFEHGRLLAQNMFTEKSVQKITIESDGKPIEVLEFAPMDLYRNEVEHFCRFLNGDVSQLDGTSLDEAAFGVHLLHAISQSLNSKCAVGVNE